MTNMTPQTAGDWRFWPNRETVSLREATGAGEYTARTVADVKRRALLWKEQAASAGGYTAKDLVWLIPEACRVAAEAPAPKAADVIRDAAGNDWTVLEVGVGKFGQTHRCVTRCLKLVYGLSETCDLLRPANTQDAAGFRVSTLAAVAGYESVPCKLQEVTSAADLQTHDAATHDRDLVAYLGQRLVLKAGDVLRVGGVLYDLRGTADWDRIDTLGQVRVRRREG